MSLWEPNFERVMKVLRLEGDPDRVPFLELFHDAEIIQRCMGEPYPADLEEFCRYHIRFMSQYGYDYVIARYPYTFPGREALLAEDTALYRRPQRGWQDEHKGPIMSWEEFETYPWPDPYQVDFSELEMYGKLLPAGMGCVSICPGGVLENLISLMGFENLCLAVVDDPELPQAIVEKIGECLVGLYEQLCDMEWVSALWLNDDMGFKTQTMLSPPMMRRYVFPYQKRLVSIAHAHNKPVMLHACGNLEKIMEDLIEDVGIDAKHSFEDTIMPVCDFKRKYGDRIGVLGGIDVHVLASSSEAEVRTYTRKRIEECAPGGGWALGSGNSVANYIPIENFLAMLDEGRKCGIYQKC
ncbi:MAG: uroporphyrinogen decarboxylase family protein [Candidatus Zipacnadales bacterium]